MRTLASEADGQVPDCRRKRPARSSGTVLCRPSGAAEQASLQWHIYPRMQGSVALQCSPPGGLAVASPQVVTHALASLQFLVVHVREPKMSLAGGVTFCTYRALKFGFFTTTIIRNIFFLEHADPPRARLGPMRNSLRLIVLARQYTQLAKGSRRSAPLLRRPFILNRTGVKLPILVRHRTSAGSWRRASATASGRADRCWTAAS